MKTIRYAVVGLIALFCGGAFADGVPLITPGPAFAANDPILGSEDTKTPDFVKLHPFVLNKNAFGANILTVTIDGKDYRFVGSVTQAPTPAPLKAAQIRRGFKQQDARSWVGTTGAQGERLVLVVVDGQLLGSIDLPPARVIWFTPGMRAMVERDRNKSTYAMNYVPLYPPMPAASGVGK